MGGGGMGGGGMGGGGMGTSLQAPKPAAKPASASDPFASLGMAAPQVKPIGGAPAGTPMGMAPMQTKPAGAPMGTPMGMGMPAFAPPPRANPSDPFNLNAAPVPAPAPGGANFGSLDPMAMFNQQPAGGQRGTTMPKKPAATRVQDNSWDQW